ncbi:MAG: hypothetical protein ACFCUI_05090 [Bernardetiaceae bacterium]
MEEIKEQKAKLEQTLAELKGKQADFFKKKKADRDPDAIQEIRRQINQAKQEVKRLYRPNKKTATPSDTNAETEA